MDKMISSAEAFRVLSDYYHHRTEEQHDALREALDRVPEAVVRCKDCKWYLDEDQKGCNLNYSIIKPNDYCSYGERRTDER